MKKALASLTAMMLSFACFSVARTEEQAGKSSDEPKQASIWMKQKLFASHNILTGLTKADYGVIAENAKSMLVLEYLEKWFRSDIPGYRSQLTDFEHANQGLVKAAQEKNLDAATVSYMQLTISCVNCHKLVRDVKPEAKPVSTSR
jgi:hypothetical protein